jgi:hypothetical protein
MQAAAASYGPWGKTDGLNDRLIELCLAPQRFSRGVIAKELSEQFGIPITRNSVISRARRLGLLMPQPAVILCKPRASLPARPIERRKHSLSGSIKPVDPALPIEPDRLVSLLEAGPGHCRYPFGEKLSLMFCGREPLEGCDYCTEHWRLMHERGRP